MSTELSYYERWHRHAREPIGPLDVEAARALDAKQEPYVVVVNESGKPSCFIEVTAGDFYGVSFLDEGLREYLAYTFEEIGGRLFLKEAVHREFEGDSGTPARGSVYRYTPDGLASMDEGEAPFRKATVKEKRVDVSRNWEDVPRFGEYAPLLRKER